jgi:hypothetical protein
MRPRVEAMTSATSGLREAYDEIRAEATRLAGAPGDMPQRVTLLNSVFLDSKRNHAFPQVALHGALWAYRFYDRRGTVSRLITYRYFYDREERARRAAMLNRFSEGFKDANRSVFIDTYSNYHFTKRYGEEAGAEELIGPELLDALNRVHHAARRDRVLDERERREIFGTALQWEQETTVGPKVKEEIGKFDCPILTTLVLKPVVRFAYFPHTRYFLFRNFADTSERIERAIASYELAESAGWDAVIATMRNYRVLPPLFFRDPAGFVRTLTRRTSLVEPDAAERVSPEGPGSTASA